MTLASFSFRDPDFIRVAYVVAAICFIIGIKMLSHPRTARRGNMIAAVGMAIAVIGTLLDGSISYDSFGNWGLILGGIIVGSIIGVVSARTVKMTAMPQMVALFNGVGGGAVALVALAEYHRYAERAGDFPLLPDVSLQILIPTVVSCVIGAMSFAGSMIAFAKLQEVMTGKPIVFGAQKVVNGLLFLAIVVATVVLCASAGDLNQGLFVGMLLASLVFGVMLIIPIGGADMPVVISMLNAFTGLSAALAGFALDNTALIIAGTLVGSSGTLLTILMGQAMNRSLTNVLFGAFGTPAAGSGASAEGLSHREATANDVAAMLSYADKVIVVPGYGLAVAQAQHQVRELADELEAKGVEVSYAIHPVAGRMPGHMNVLLAEADVPYDQLKEMDEINPEFPSADVALVIGANDVTNPAAREDQSSPIYGMPILDVDKAENVVVLKRSMNPGFAGIDNHLYYEPNTVMLFGDAKDSVTKLVQETKTA